uniref:Uncharacterized protein n=1 Tax=Strigamia maritima TaxID=126957 RepID=T1JN16_STRMM
MGHFERSKIKYYIAIDFAIHTLLFDYMNRFFLRWTFWEKIRLNTLSWETLPLLFHAAIAAAILAAKSRLTSTWDGDADSRVVSVTLFFFVFLLK